MFLGFAMSRFVPTIGISFGMRKQEITASALPSQAANFRIKNVTDSANRRIRYIMAWHNSVRCINRKNILEKKAIVKRLQIRTIISSSFV